MFSPTPPKPGTKEYMLYYSIYIRFKKNRQNESVVTVRVVVPFGGVRGLVTEKGA